MPSPYKILLVDDSSTIRIILKKILSDVAFIQIIGEAENGMAAIDCAKELQPEIILLDVEMPEMDGITALPYIKSISPHSQIIMVSTLTADNAAISMKAMSLGASDCLQKPDSGVDKDIFKAELIRKIQALGVAAREKKNIASAPLSAFIPQLHLNKINIKPAAIAIASSTGGPQALQVVFSGLKNNMPQLPIFITQHMPPVFTKYLADSISATHGVKCFEGKDGMEVSPGAIYLAPGDFHMLIKAEGIKTVIKLDKSAQENFCRPAADPMLRSLLEVYGNKLLVVVLTGMGQDGMQGAKQVAEKGGIVIAQDKASSVVWGMPGAVYEAGISSGIYPIDKIAERIIHICESKGVANAPK